MRCLGKSLVGTSGINGDAFYFSSDHKTFVLVDGASGAGEEGKVIMANHCIRTIKENSFSDSGLSAKDYLNKMFWKINEDLIRISQESKTLTFGTLVLCVIHDHNATIASIGDSPVFLVHSDGIRRVARPKKTYQKLIDMGVMTDDEADKCIKQLPEPMWSMFERFIPMIVPVYALEEVPLRSGDLLLFCSDGVSDYVMPEELRELINPVQLSESIGEVIELAKERSIEEKNRREYDDITLLVYCSTYESISKE